MSVSNKAVSSSTASGILRQKQSATGTASASACPPGQSGMGPMAVVALALQATGSPLRQGPHQPQPITPDTKTRSPMRKLRTSDPSSAMVPMTSWPGRIASPPMAPWRMWRSEPQMALFSTVTMAPSGPGSLGSGTVSSETMPPSRITVARIWATYTESDGHLLSPLRPCLP